MSDHESCDNRCDRRAFLSEGATLLAVATLFAPAAQAMPVRFLAALGRRASFVSYALPATDGVTIDREQNVMLARVTGQVFAFSMTCPHQRTALRWQEGPSEFQCPKHKSRYRPDGSFIAGRATRAMDRFAISRDGETIIVDVDRLFRVDDQPTEWAAAVVRV